MANRRVAATSVHSPPPSPPPSPRPPPAARPAGGLPALVPLPVAAARCAGDPLAPVPPPDPPADLTGAEPALAPPSVSAASSIGGAFSFWLLLTESLVLRIHDNCVILSEGPSRARCAASCAKGLWPDLSRARSALWRPRPRTSRSAYDGMHKPAPAATMSAMSDGCPAPSRAHHLPRSSAAGSGLGGALHLAVARLDVARCIL